MKRGENSMKPIVDLTTLIYKLQMKKSIEAATSMLKGKKSIK